MKYFDFYNKTIIDSKASTVYQFKKDSKTLNRVMGNQKDLLNAVTKFARYKGIINANESIALY